MLLANDLETKINVIKFKEKTIVLSFIEIGKELLEIRKYDTFKAKYSTFELFIQHEFSFGHQQALKFMKVAEKFNNPGPDIIKNLGIEKLYLLTFVPDHEARELIEEVNEKVMPVNELKKRVERIRIETEPTVQTNNEIEESYLRNIRVGQNFIEQIQMFLIEREETAKVLKEKIEEWAESIKDKKLEDLKGRVLKGLEKI